MILSLAVVSDGWSGRQFPLCGLPKEEVYVCLVVCVANYGVNRRPVFL